MSLSLYVHIPFCQRKCPYCDFNTYAGLNRLFEPYTAALVQEIQQAGAARSRPAVRTIFLGGGTPTVLPAALLAQIIDACCTAFDVLPDAEITSEANPGTVDVGRFAAMRQMGVNRLSMGVQSFDPIELDFLGRIHSAGEAVAAMAVARAAGFDNINLDFIYGLPDQPPAVWQRTLEQALALAPEHISLYSLTIEEGTPFGDWAAAGRLAQPSPDLAADMYEIADEILSSTGYVQYEISNWARGSEVRGTDGGRTPIYQSTNLPITIPPFACHHNLTYWRNEAFLGFGPGAHSSEGGRRWAVMRPVPEYIERINRGESAVDFVEQIDERLAMGETMMLGLRLVQEGVTFQRFQQRHGWPMMDVFGAEIHRLERLGLLEVLSDRVRLTRGARLVGNQVFAAFLP
ncbi:MAG TPA: radical SAM family heme chaperone HemW [Anaerolineae bacterium]|nr:radical SAM family heme chaperone HemW [Anaerolineae bacterium]